MDERLRRIERSGDYRALAHAYARKGQSREAYGIMIACLKDELKVAKDHKASYTTEIIQAGKDRFQAAGGCMICSGACYTWDNDSWRRKPCVCGGKTDVSRMLLSKTDEERDNEWHKRKIVDLAYSELRNWEPGVERGDLVMYDNERARAKFAKDAKDAGMKVPLYTCGVIAWCQLDARCGIKTIMGPHEGMTFFTSIRNVSHVNAWKKVMERESIQAKLDVYRPMRNDWVYCRGHYGRVTRVTRLRGTAILGIGMRTPGNLFHWFPAHECSKAEAPKTNILEEMA